MSVSLNSVGVANLKENELAWHLHSGALNKHTALIEFEVTFATNLAILNIVCLRANSRKLAGRIGSDKYEMATN